ncbi:MAG: RNA polymerase sigma factor [Deltaproteobacteria bacterium]|nr:RNA polymerase sigma factor [Deltaproteobacteria bacterium]
MVVSAVVEQQDEADDRALLSAWLDGDRDAGHALIEAHYRALFTFFNTRVDPDTSADLTQAVFVTLCEQGAKFREVHSIRAYLLGIARWKLVAHFRRGQGTTHDLTPFDEAFVPAPEAQSLTSQWLAKERGSVVVEALRQLPLDHQIILELKDYEGLTGREIAEVFGVPPGTVATRVRRARQDLAAAVRRVSGSMGMAETTATSLAEHMRAVRTAVQVATPEG